MGARAVLNKWSIDLTQHRESSSLFDLTSRTGWDLDSPPVQLEDGFRWVILKPSTKTCRDATVEVTM
ncbi:hypothetical protein L345_06297 [Ophiophagus hannah]|uniref:Uncharacterized protein n=1 Tax=Ophiophagus hannah TaxID=8665 RepID=V8P1V3_OPHHA|nr:hypothetical protein L345_06297 [Ophiophagus hannah]